MAKKRKTSRNRKASRPKPAAKAGVAKPDMAKSVAAKARNPRQTPRQRRAAAANDNERLNVVFAVLVLIVVALGVYYYQLSSHESVSASNTPLAMEKK